LTARAFKGDGRDLFVAAVLVDLKGYALAKISNGARLVFGRVLDPRTERRDLTRIPFVQEIPGDDEGAVALDLRIRSLRAALPGLRRGGERGPPARHGDLILVAQR